MGHLDTDAECILKSTGVKPEFQTHFRYCFVHFQPVYVTTELLSYIEATIPLFIPTTYMLSYYPAL